VTAAGTAAAAATVLSAYLNNVTTSATNADGVRLVTPGTGNIGKAQVVINNTAVNVRVYPAVTSQAIDGVTGPVTLLPGQRGHFVVSASNAYQRALDS
jgi:hypothetical protein